MKASLSGTIVLSFVCAFASLFGPNSAGAESLSATIVDTRTTLAFRVKAAAAQRWLPAPWKIGSFPKGPFKGANLLIIFIDRLLHRNAEGKPAAGGSYRMAVLLVPAANPTTGKKSPFIIRVYAPQGAPGPYKNSLRASVRREAARRSADTGPGIGREKWGVQMGNKNGLTFQMEFKRGRLKRFKREVRPRSAVAPALFRIYRYEQMIDIVRSAPAGVDRVRGYKLSVNVPELGKMFDGTEVLIGIAVIPRYRRQTLLP